MIRVPARRQARPGRPECDWDDHEDQDDDPNQHRSPNQHGLILALLGPWPHRRPTDLPLLPTCWPGDGPAPQFDQNGETEEFVHVTTASYAPSICVDDDYYVTCIKRR